MRYSHQRELIFDILKNTAAHPTAQMVYEQAREIEPRISLGTVYRNLKEMNDRKEIRVIKTEDAEIHYDARMTDHNHFVCRYCSRIYDLFDSASMEKCILGHRVESVNVIYYGKCSDCCAKEVE